MVTVKTKDTEGFLTTMLDYDSKGRIIKLLNR